jgi:hypothetical protein
MDSERFMALVKYSLEQLPSFLAFVGCIVFAITRWKRYPKIALIVTIALTYLLLHQITFSLVYFFVPSYFIRNAPSETIQTVIRNVYLVIGLISNTVLAIGIIIFLAGIFMRRKPRAAV